MNVVELPFGEWLPDQPDYKNPGLVEAENVLPVVGGYGPFATPVASDDVVNGNVIGARLFFRGNGTTVIAGGTSTRLFVLVGGTVTETNPPYTAATAWRFERFNNLIVAVSKTNAPQYLDNIESDTSWSALPGTPPKASVIGRVGDFLVLGDVDDGTDRPNRVQWGGFNNPTVSWVVDPGELSSWQDLDPKYGKVTGIVGGRWGLVFQQRAIWRMTFVGAPKVFDFELVADDRGCIAPDSIVTIGYQTYFFDRDGVYVTNGSEVASIGNERINAFLEGEMDPARRDKTQGAINWPQRCIVWSFRIPGDSTYQRQLCYSFVTQKFTAASQTVDWLVQANQDALTLADLAALFPSGLGSMSAYEIGTAEWKSRDRLFAAFVDIGSTSAFAPFTGAAAAGYVTTGDYSIEPGRRALVAGLSPIVERMGSGITCQVRHRPTQGATYAVRSPVAPGADTFCPSQVDNWFFSFRTYFAAGADWGKATGLWVRTKRTGKR